MSTASQLRELASSLRTEHDVLTLRATYLRQSNASLPQYLIDAALCERAANELDRRRRVKDPS